MRSAAVPCTTVLIASLSPKKYSTSPLAGEARLVIQSAGQSFDTGWKDGGQLPFGKYSPINLRFVAPGPQATLSVEVRSRWRVPGGGWYVDEVALEVV